MPAAEKFIQTHVKIRQNRLVKQKSKDSISKDSEKEKDVPTKMMLRARLHLKEIPVNLTARVPSNESILEQQLKKQSHKKKPKKKLDREEAEAQEEVRAGYYR